MKKMVFLLLASYVFAGCVSVCESTGGMSIKLMSRLLSISMMIASQIGSQSRARRFGALIPDALKRRSPCVIR